MAGSLVKSVFVKILGDDAEAKVKLDAITAKAEELKKLDPTITPKVDSAVAQAKLRVIRDELRAVGDESVTARVKVKSSGDAAAAAAGSGGFGLLTKVLIGASPLLAGLAPAAGAAGIGLAGMGVLAAPALSQVKQGLSTIATAQAAVNNAVTATARNTALAHLRQDWAQMPAPIAAAVRSVQAFQHEFAAIGVKSGLNNAVFADITKIMGVIRQVLPDIIPLAKTAASALGQVFGGIGKAATNPATAQFFKQIGTMVGPAIKGIGQLAITLGKLLGGALQALAPVMAPALSFINKLASALSTVLQGGKGGGIIGALAPMLAAILKAAQPLIKPLQMIIVSLTGQLAPVIRQMAGPLATFGVELAKLIVPMIPLWAATMKLQLAWLPLLPLVLKLADVLLKMLIPAITPVIRLVTELATQMAGSLTRTVSSVTSGIGRVISIFNGLAPSIGRAVAGFGNLLVRAGQNLIMGLVHGIESVASAPINALSSIVSGLRNLLPFSPAKTGPLSGPGDPTLAGRKIPLMIAAGMRATSPSVAAAGASMIAGASPRLAGRAGAPAGGGGWIEARLSFRSTGSSFMDALVKDLRVEIRTNGAGSVQNHLGWGAA